MRNCPSYFNELSPIEMKKILLLAALVVGYVASTSRLANVELGMPKSQVRDAMGDPRAVRGSVINKKGQRVELWEYRLDDTGGIEWRGNKWTCPIITNSCYRRRSMM